MRIFKRSLCQILSLIHIYLLYDKATNKQFITVQTSGGNTFYIGIDYDKPTDEDGEQYQTYFLNMVDEADLLAAMQAEMCIRDRPGISSGPSSCGPV